MSSESIVYQCPDGCKDLETDKTGAGICQTCGHCYVDDDNFATDNSLAKPFTYKSKSHFMTWSDAELREMAMEDIRRAGFDPKEYENMRTNYLDNLARGIHVSQRIKALPPGPVAIKKSSSKKSKSKT